MTPSTSKRPLFGLLTLLVVTASESAVAKPCSLDLQVVYTNADQITTDRPLVQELDRWLFGMASAALAPFMRQDLYSNDAAKIRALFKSRQISGTVDVQPISNSKRLDGWTLYNPAADEVVSTSGNLFGLKGLMLVVSVDDPVHAAGALGRSKAGAAFAQAFGRDVRGRVYEHLIRDTLRTMMGQRGYELLYNTGLGVRCSDG